MFDFFIDWLIRASLLTAGVHCTLALFRNLQPRARHLAWALATIALLALPALRAFHFGLELLTPLPALITDQQTELTPETHPSDSARNAPRADSRTGIGHFQESALAAYAIVSLLLLARLFAGTWRARRLIQGSMRKGALLIHPDRANPVTVGWFRPQILLPAGFEQWARERQRVALTHEHEHARWRDPLMQWLALLNRSLLWIHPATWWIERSMAELAEDACDTAVLEKGHSATSYATFLLDCAGGPEELPSFAMGAAGRGLGRRIPRILAHAEAPVSSRRWLRSLAVVLCGLVCLVCSTLTLRFVRMPVVYAEDRGRTLSLVILTPRRASLTAVTAPTKRADGGNEQAIPFASGRPRAQSALTGIYFDLAGMNRSARQSAVEAATQWFSSGAASGRGKYMVLVHDDVGISVAQNPTSDPAEIITALEQISQGDFQSASETVETRMDGIESAVHLFREVGGSRELICLLGGELPRAGSPGEASAWKSNHVIRFVPGM